MIPTKAYSRRHSLPDLVNKVTPKDPELVCRRWDPGKVLSLLQVHKDNLNIPVSPLYPTITRNHTLNPRTTANMAATLPPNRNMSNIRPCINRILPSHNSSNKAPGTQRVACREDRNQSHRGDRTAARRITPLTIRVMTIINPKARQTLIVSNLLSCLNQSSKGARVRHNRAFTAKDCRATLVAPPQGSKVSNSAVQLRLRAHISLINPPQEPLPRLEAPAVEPTVRRKKRTAPVSQLARVLEVRVPKGQLGPVIPFQVSKVSSSRTSSTRVTSAVHMDSSSLNNPVVPTDSLIRLNTISSTAVDRAIGNERTSLPATLNAPRTSFQLLNDCHILPFSLLIFICRLFFFYLLLYLPLLFPLFKMLASRRSFTIHV
jgi:hypothetical protein